MKVKNWEEINGEGFFEFDEFEFIISMDKDNLYSCMWKRAKGRLNFFLNGHRSKIYYCKKIKTLVEKLRREFGC